MVDSVRDLLGSILPGVDFAELHGFVHICALSSKHNGGPLCSIRICEFSPKSDSDFFLLMAMRARATIQVQSVHTVASEGGASPSVVGAHAEALMEWRQQLFGLKEGASLAGIQFLLTRGGRSLDPSWPCFSSYVSTPSCIVAPDEALGELLAPWEFCKPSSLPASSLPGPLGMPSLLAFIKDSLHKCKLLPNKPPFVDHLISIEAGATLTKTLYTAGSEACPVDYLCLSVYSGLLDPRAQGDTVFHSMTLVDSMFNLVSSSQEGDWTFSLYRKKNSTCAC